MLPNWNLRKVLLVRYGEILCQFFLANSVVYECLTRYNHSNIVILYCFMFLVVTSSRCTLSCV